MDTAPTVAPQKAPMPATTPAPSMQSPYAGFWKRVVAAIIDGIVLFAVGLALGLVFVLIVGSLGESNPAIGFVELLRIVLSIAIGWLYSALQESSPHQATLGKRAMSIKVTDMNGQRLSFGRATGRHFAKILSGIILGIGYIMAGFTKKKQALHDIIAECLVVNS